MNWEKLLKENKILNGKKGFRDLYECFSNFYKHRTISIMLPYKKENAILYQANDVETLFQAAKSNDHIFIQRIINSKFPSEAKRIGRYIKLREDWELIKEEVMKELVRKKFEAVPGFKQLLMDIPDDIIIAEFNTWNDKEWGVCSKTLIGKNKLGNILMELRKEFIKKEYEDNYFNLKKVFIFEVKNVIKNYKKEFENELKEDYVLDFDKLFDYYYYDVEPIEFNIFNNKELIEFIKKYIKNNKYRKDKND